MMSSMLAPRPSISPLLTKKNSGDSGVGSSRSSGAWSTREARLRAAATISTPTTSGPSTRALGITTDSRATKSRRASVRVQRWLVEQSHFAGDATTVDAQGMDAAGADAHTFGTPCNPYLAYPGVPGCSVSSVRDSGYGDCVVDGTGKLGGGGGGVDGGARRDHAQASASSSRPRTRPEQHGHGPSSQRMKQHNQNEGTGEPHMAKQSTSSLRAPRPMSVLSLASWRNLSLAKSLPHRGAAAATQQKDDTSNDALFSSAAQRKSPKMRKRSPIPEPFREGEADVPRVEQTATARNKASSGTLRAADVLGSVPEEAGAHAHAPAPPRSLRQRIEKLVHVGPGPAPEVVPALNMHSPRPSTSTSSATTTSTGAVDKERLSASSSKGKKASAREVRPGRFTISLSRAKRGVSPTPSCAGAPAGLALGSPTRSTFSMSTQTVSTSASPEHHHQHHHPYLHAGEFTESGSGALGFEVPVPVFRERRAIASSSALSTLSMGSIGTLATSIGSGLGISGGMHVGHGHGQGHGHSASGGGGGIFGASGAAGRRKRLVVAGIPHDDEGSVEGLRRWCERFGEVRNMSRAQNGDVVVDFRRADVADTVCRISAQVYIPGVGSVHMSWVAGKKR